MILLDRRGKSKKLHRKLHSFATVKSHDGSALSVDTLTDCELYVCFGKLSDSASVAVLHDFIDRGGSVAIFSTETEPNLKNFLSFYGIQIEEGAVVRAVYHQGFPHPKHAFIQNGIAQQFASEQQSLTAEDMTSSMAFLYPNGTTLSVESPSFTLLSSGSTSYPVDCPVA
eukprot:CAMPEP_0201705470 /NCGR_PEP_ID=MMETSP0578-20130828/45858_1 /ASSEMBLY_ACC=CAM_ASM_000663 /TAXON_ID=267565 /ORGANISM="Skeletonema grethea, Strain CCMP 1804" /LENGTH=169 /DNA_ID=CAMNT_0048193715 /DNA_START=42 /DNA_END=547 /DNA_ORIENTATION=-